MAIFAYMLVGLIVGILVHVAMPPMRFVGLWGGALLGLAGGLFGGIISSIVGPHTTLTQVNPLGIGLAAVFAALVSVGVMLAMRRRAFY